MVKATLHCCQNKILDKISASVFWVIVCIFDGSCLQLKVRR